MQEVSNPLLGDGELDMDTWQLILDRSHSFICGDSCVPCACGSP